MRRRRPGQAAAEAGAGARRAARARFQPRSPIPATCSGRRRARLAADAEGAARRLRRARQRRRPRAAEAEAACAHLGWPERALYVGGLRRVRARAGVPGRARPRRQVVQYPVVETRQDPRLHICREVLAPADISRSGGRSARGRSPAARSRRSTGWARSASRCSCCADGQVVVNELAPRPHNSAPLHDRRVLELAVRQPRAGGARPAAGRHRPARARGGHGQPAGHAQRRRHADAALGVPRTFVHLYGKSRQRPGRKMGHVTAVGDHAWGSPRAGIAAASRVRV